MGKIVVSEQISLDGVVHDPSGVEKTGRGGWVNEMSQADRKAWTEHEYAESIHRIVVGAGPRLWGDTAAREAFRLTDSRLLGSLPHMVYEAVAA